MTKSRLRNLALPIGLAVFALGRAFIRADRGLGLEHGVDWLGSLLVTASLGSAIYAIIGATTHGWTSALVLGTGLLAAVLMAVFVRRQGRVANPLMPLRVFRNRQVTFANVIQMLFVAGLFGMFFLGALEMQRVLHYDAVEVGLAFLPVALGIAALSLGFAARLIMRFGAKPTLVAGTALAALDPAEVRA